MTMRRRDRAYEIETPHVLANFRPSPAERFQARKGVSVPPGWRMPRYVAIINQVSCCTCPENRAMHAHHIRFGEAGRMAGLGRQPPDWFVVPLCWHCHDSLHHHPDGEESWWWVRAIDPYALRRELFALWLRHRHDPDHCVELMREVRERFALGAIRDLAEKRRQIVHSRNDGRRPS